ncbi:MAG: hypothetical protein WC091_21290, partial [Sulfuricellaceae bacterium]
RTDFTVFLVNSHSIDQKNGEIWTVQADLQPISFKSDSLLALSRTIAGSQQTFRQDLQDEQDRKPIL